MRQLLQLYPHCVLQFHLLPHVHPYSTPSGCPTSTLIHSHDAPLAAASPAAASLHCCWFDSSCIVESCSTRKLKPPQMTSFNLANHPHGVLLPLILPTSSSLLLWLSSLRFPFARRFRQITSSSFPLPSTYMGRLIFYYISLGTRLLLHVAADHSTSSNTTTRTRAGSPSPSLFMLCDAKLLNNSKSARRINKLLLQKQSTRLFVSFSIAPFLTCQPPPRRSIVLSIPPQHGRCSEGGEDVKSVTYYYTKVQRK